MSLPPANPIAALLGPDAPFDARTRALLDAAQAQDQALRRGLPPPTPPNPGAAIRLDGRRPAGARLIAVEGLDGSGGTTQLRLLAEALRTRGLRVHTTAEPTRGPIGLLIRQALGDPALLAEEILPLLFAADRRDHLVRELLPALARGEVVLSDRYTASSLAYQSLAAPMEQVLALNAPYPPADLTLMLELPVPACLARIEARGLPRDRFETLDRLQAIEATYARGLALLRARGHRVAHVPAHGTPAEVHARVLQEVLPCLSSRRWVGRRTLRSGSARSSWSRPGSGARSPTP